MSLRHLMPAAGGFDRGHWPFQALGRRAPAPEWRFPKARRPWWDGLEGTFPPRPRPCPYSFTFSRCAISPISPRRKASTTVTKIAPWITVTQAPISAR